ncbi:MAG: hypothetical protein ACM3YO_07915 [Bacteroidota bacterium]
MKKGILLGMAATIGLASPALAATKTAQRMITSQPTAAATILTGIPGPTRYRAVQRSEVLPQGATVVSGNLLFGASPSGLVSGNAPGINLGITANALEARADMGLGPNFELGTGIGYIAATPWIGQLNMTGKFGIMGGAGSPFALAGIGGLGIISDQNGIANVGFVLGAPISTTLMVGAANPLMLTAAPQVSLGWISPNTPAGIAGGMQTNLGLGLGGAFGITDALFAIVDTNLGFPTAGLISDSNFGVRYAFSPSVTGDLFLGVKAIPANLALAGSTTASYGLGAGASWRF